MNTTKKDLALFESIKVKIDEELRSIIPTYLASRREDIGRLRRALASMDYQSVVYMAHVIRGNGAAFGFERLGTLGHELEWAALKEDSDSAHAAVEAMATYLDRVRIEYVREGVAAVQVGRDYSPEHGTHP